MLYLVVGAIAVYVAYQALFGDSTDDRPPSRTRSSYDSHRDRPSHRRPHDDSQQRPIVDHPQQKEFHEAQVDNTYATLRARAKREGDLMSKCFKQSQEAYERRDRARAKALSDEGKRHALLMEKLNEKASAIVFQENNQDKSPGEVDLHDLYVKEALAYSEKAITEARRRGDSELRLIVGQGSHSEGGIARVKPAIQEDIKKRGMQVDIDPKNAGVLIVRLGGRLTR